MATTGEIPSCSSFRERVQLGRCMWPRFCFGQTRCEKEITAFLTNPKTLQFANRLSLLMGLVLIASVTGCGRRKSSETIAATAFGIGAQLGKSFGVKIIIDEFSSPDNRDIPVLTFQKGEHDGLVNAA